MVPLGWGLFLKRLLGWIWGPYKGYDGAMLGDPSHGPRRHYIQHPEAPDVCYGPQHVSSLIILNHHHERLRGVCCSGSS